MLCSMPQPTATFDALIFYFFISGHLGFGEFRNEHVCYLLLMHDGAAD